jgi:translation initiation factor 2 subunit 1
MEIEEGDIVLCTVDRIAGTLVFVKIDETNQEGSIVLSEIAPGRIRNLREYVIPKKKIVCKVLKINSSGGIQLSLRRVSQKEVKEAKEKFKQENSLKSVLTSILGDNAKRIISEIEAQENFFDFFQNAKENPKHLEKILGEESSKKILEILNSQKSKKTIIKKQFVLKTKESNGLEKIKKILGTLKEAEIRYLSSGKYSIKVEDEDIKKTDQKIKQILSDLEKQAKKENMEFLIK